MSNADKKISYLWLMLLAIIFPIAQMALYFIRSNNFSTNMVILGLYFILMGLVSGIFLIYLLNKDVGNKNSKRNITIGLISLN